MAGHRVFRFRPRGICAALLLAAVTWVRAETAAPPPGAGAAPLPNFAELEAAGAIVGEVRFVSHDIFDLDDPKESGLLYRLANTLHIRTRPEVLARSVLFKTGDRVSRRLIEETERLFRANRYLYDIRIAPVAWRDGVVDIEISARDTWTLNPGLTYSRQGGKNAGGVLVSEQNLLGTGTGVIYQHAVTAERTTRETVVSQERAFDGFTTIRLSSADNSDGYRRGGAIERPFYSADVRWAAALLQTDEQRVDTIYHDGIASGRYQAHERTRQVSAGWSPGLREGWAHRYSLGWQDQQERYLPVDAANPPVLPEDQRLTGPLLRYELIEENIAKLKNRDQIGRPEYFSLGFNLRAQLVATTRASWLYELSLADGYTPAPGTLWVVSSTVKGRYGGEGLSRQRAEAEISLYRSHDDRRVGFASLRLEAVRKVLPAELIQLGGDTGLRGYPLRYQSGEQMASMTLEQRVYTDWYLFRLFRIGGAAFYDIGQAWDGKLRDAGKRWLADAGFGLRITNTRVAFGNVLHADLAFPLGAGSDIKKVQFLVKTRLSY